MKKTLSITLGGRSFSIEEDGYSALDSYLKSLRTHFANDPSVDELVNDIEFSFGEKFSEKLSKDKQVVTLEDVEAVIAVVGRVEEIADEDLHETDSPKTNPTTDPATPIKKRLYRNPDDRVLAGVCSGIAAYFGISPLAVRIIALVLLFVNGLGLLLYIILWIAVPAAETSLQKLEMQGKEPNLNEFQELTKEKPTNQPASVASRILNAPFRFLGFVFECLRRFFQVFGSVIRVVAGVVFLISAFVFATLGTMATVVLGTNINSRYITSDLPLAELAHDPLYYLGLGSVYLLGLIPLIFFAILGVSLIRRRNHFQAIVTATLIAIWILSAGGVAAAASKLGPWMYTNVRELREKAVTSRTIPIESFDKISVADNLHVVVRKGETFSVKFTGPENELPFITATTTNGTLVLRMDKLEPSDEFRFCFSCIDQYISGVITLPTLTTYTGLDNSSGRIEGFTSDLQFILQDNASVAMQDAGRSLETTTTQQYLTLQQDDNSSSYFKGKVAGLNVTLRDNANIEADELDAAQVNVTTEDNSRAVVSPLQVFAATSTENSYIRSSNAVTSSTVSESRNGRIYINDERVHWSEDIK